MKSQDGESARSFQLAPRSGGKAAVGIAAMVAVGSFSFLVFGPLADQRALQLAGAGNMVADPVAASAPLSRDRYARMLPREFHEGL